ncbi:hypothetical protein H5410_004687 [Solanum commersonii]|uniref:Reverse transcriptase zinc-binding domain-containing protein n=1 Tax=Solanum commersonii TaxID=4109 RepID=A0A9J6B8Q7_SOLCO|nr:hypothetical protein H5410_004687 [Solanum commersonii]
MCEQEAEVNDHLFLHCKAALSLWNMFLALLGVKWVMPSTTKELLKKKEEEEENSGTSFFAC